MELPRVAGALLRTSQRAASSQTPFIRLQQQYFHRSISPLLYARSFSSTPFVRSESSSSTGPSQDAKSENTKPESNTNNEPKNTTSSPAGLERFQFLSEKSPKSRSSPPRGRSPPNMKESYFEGMIFGGASKPTADKPTDVWDALWGSSKQAAAWGDVIDSTGRPPTQEYTGPMPVLNSSTGRSIVVDPNAGADLGKSVRKLEILLAQNRVRQDIYRQRFHERPGLKRKRLKSERWRKRFKEGFQYVTARVNRLRQQGW